MNQLKYVKIFITVTSKQANTQYTLAAALSIVIMVMNIIITQHLCGTDIGTNK